MIHKEAIHTLKLEGELKKVQMREEEFNKTQSKVDVTFRNKTKTNRKTRMEKSTSECRGNRPYT